VLAVDTIVQIVPDKAFYHPGEAVTLTISGANGKSGAQVKATVRYLGETLTTLSASLQDGAASLSWTPPPTTPRGYGVDVEVVDADGKVVASGSTAFDVLDDWLQAPRYGFLTNFSPGRSDIEATMDWVSSYHVNGLQFYDWQYRHETLLPPASAITDPTTKAYVDVLDRVHSLDTVNRLIDAAHAHNIAAMPYTAIYGASYEFYEQHPDWALFVKPGQPYDFADFLKIMDPTPGSPWANHLLNEFADVLDKTAFDGIHIDQYGAPTHGLNAAGQQVNLETAFPAFIDAAAAIVHEKRGAKGATIFNLVRNWPVRTVAPSDENVVYIEVWDPYVHFMDLPRIVAQAHTLGGGKPVVIAAYILPEHFVNARLSNALIFGSGAYHLEIGEPNAMLSDPYFPNLAYMNDEDKEIERKYYDFLVRYENVLALGTSDGEDRATALTIDGVPTVSFRSEDRVAVIARQAKDSSFETYSLVNLMGIGDGQWNGGITQAPTPLSALATTIHVNKPVKRVWLASPDGTDASAQAADFTTGSDAEGDLIRLNVPTLAYWTMLVVEYQS